MPNVWCHVLLGSQFTKYLPDDVKKDIFHGPSRPVFRFGCLGPDFFLFHGWNRLYYKSRHDVSSYLHRYHCKDALMYSIEQVAEERRQRKPWWTLGIYTLGVVSHFLVDATIHPLVYQIVPKSKALKNMHVKLEVEMDVYLAKGLGLPCETIIQNPAANLVIPRHATHEICRYYYNLVNGIYKEELRPISRGKVLEAMQDYIAVFELLRARGKLYHLSRGVAAASCDKIHFDWFWHPEDVSEEVSHLLEDGHFWQLCDEAIALGQKILPMIWQYWYGEGSLAEIRAELPKKNYLGDPEP